MIYAATYHNEDTWLDGKTIKTMDELIDWVSDTFVSFPFDERFDEESRAAAARCTAASTHDRLESQRQSETRCPMMHE